MEPKKAKVLAESTTVINNYYINIGGNKWWNTDQITQG
jgi:hypothetical protein